MQKLEFVYTFIIDVLPFEDDDIQSNIVEFLSDNNYKGVCYRKDDRVRVITIGLTRREVEQMKSEFNGYRLKELHDYEVLIDCLDPFIGFYGILKNKEDEEL